MRACLPALLALACGSPRDGTLLEVSSAIEPLDRLTLTVLADTGALLVDREVPDEGGPPELPGLVALEVGERREHLRVLAWGWRGEERVAYGRAELDVAPDRDQTVPLALAAPTADGDGDGVPDADDVCPSIADPEQADGDADGAGDACVCSGNLLGNGGFETGTVGWTAPYGSIAWHDGGHLSSHAAELCKADTGGVSLDTISDDPDAVDDPPVGARYRLQAWAMAEPEPAQNLRPRLRERDAAGNEIEIHQNSGITLTADWQEISLDAEIVGPDPASLEVYFSVVDAADGTCFVIDDICLTDISSAP
jgi:hypothetical protein